MCIVIIKCLIKYFKDYFITNEFPNKFVRVIIPEKTIDKKIQIKEYNSYKKVDKLDKNSLNILVDGEANNLNINKPFDFIFTTLKKNYNNKTDTIYIPFWSMSFNEINNYSIPDLLKRYKYPKYKFCAFMYSNCNVQTRNNFFDILQKKSGNRVDSLGKCKRNLNIIDKNERDKNFFLDKAIDNYKKYKFVISFENKIEDGYITEKIILPLLAGCIPIYLGPKEVEEQFNKNCFISVNDFESFEDCISYVLYVDNNDELYNKYINSPIISESNLKIYADWYYRSHDLYDKLYLKLPFLKTKSYKPLKLSNLNSEKNIKIINLDTSIGRWEEIQKQFKNKPFLQYERFPAILGKDYKKYMIQDIKYLEKDDIKNGELGIILSSMEIYTCLVEDTKNDYYLILEDDIILLDGIKEISYYVNNAPIDWDMIFLGYNKLGCKVNNKDNKNNYIKMHKDCMPGAFAYIIRKRTAQYMLNFIFPIQYPLDVYFQKNTNNLNLYLYYPGIVKTDYNNQTTIHNSGY